MLLGVKFDRNTSLHLSEYRAQYADKKEMIFGSPIMVDGVRKWAEYRDLDFNSDDFEQIGEQFTHELELVREGSIGNAAALLIPQRELVDFGTKWMSSNR